jgi:hypothetical protein
MNMNVNIGRGVGLGLSDRDDYRISELAIVFAEFTATLSNKS